MSWQHAIVVVFYALASLSTVASIGIERQPITPKFAAVVLTLNGVIVFLILTG